MVSEENGKRKEQRKGSSDFSWIVSDKSSFRKMCRDLFMLERFRFPISYKIYF